MNKCSVCGQVLKIVTHYNKGYQGQDWTHEGPERHEPPNACIMHLATELDKLANPDRLRNR